MFAHCLSCSKLHVKYNNAQYLWSLLGNPNWDVWVKFVHAMFSAEVQYWYKCLTSYLSFCSVASRRIVASWKIIKIMLIARFGLLVDMCTENVLVKMQFNPCNPKFSRSSLTLSQQEQPYVIFLLLKPNDFTRELRTPGRERVVAYPVNSISLTGMLNGQRNVKSR